MATAGEALAAGDTWTSGSTMAVAVVVVVIATAAAAAAALAQRAVTLAKRDMG